MHISTGIRIGLHGIVLTLLDIVGIAFGAVLAYNITGTPNRFSLQVSIAVCTTLACFCGWVAVVGALRWRTLRITGACEALWCLTASILWNPVIFFPLHYFTQGYVSSVRNIAALAIYQIPVNAVALILAFGILRFRGAPQQPTNA